MNAALRVGYESTAQIARGLAAFAPSSQNKLIETFASRRNVIARFEAFARDPARPLLWMHAPSVGEGLQARPVLDLVRARRPDMQLAYTYFSPSARVFASKLDVDFTDVLPFDSAPDMRRALAALSPAVLIFSKLDVWPTLAREACARGTRLGVVSATLARESSRRGGFAAALLRDAYARLDRVGAISTDDADRLIALGVPASRVSVTGDTRYDQVSARAAAVDRGSSVLAPLASERPTLVAGSTWPSDEGVLQDAWLAMRVRVRESRLIIAPHEPTPLHVASIERWAFDAGLSCARLGTDGAATAEVVVVDGLGVLGDLYALATVAFVGGGFHDGGLHSVLEPAAFGAPVLFGPKHSGSRDAGLLMDEDAAESVSNADELASALERWLGVRSERDAAGFAALRVVRRGLGAAERSYALVAELMR